MPSSQSSPVQQTESSSSQRSPSERVVAASPSPRHKKAGTSWPARVIKLVADWFGIYLLFCLWSGMLLLTFHITVIPRTCSQHWPKWVPLFGGMRSVLSHGGSPRPDCGPVGQMAALGSGAETDVMATYTVPDHALGLALALAALTATPLILSFGAALIAKWQQAPRAHHTFHPEHEKPDWSPSERTWKRETCERIRQAWSIESRRAVQAQHRMIQHACMFGFAASAIFAWGLLMNHRPDLALQTRMVMLAATAAALTSFSLSFGRIAVRASIRDTSARMFAYALRAIIASVLGAVLLVALLWHNTGSAADAAHKASEASALMQQPFKSASSFMMLGLVLGFLGESILSNLVSRAAGVIGIQLGNEGTDGRRQLHAIDGMGEDDIRRLGEEGIDSIHALALASSSQLYFNTPYTLQRICDWQDQALLITYLGLAKAQTFREKLMIRGAIDLQRKADFLVGHSGTEISALTKDDAQTLEIIRSALGFISVEQARECLFPMAQDETTRRLRVLHRGSVSEKSTAVDHLTGE